ncbi:MAG: RNA polymerase factor sigma-54 [Victivallaceae bacterium]|nr:RNA polymerase factor sigma-54 [Victivallaceae bacterium]
MAEIGQFLGNEMRLEQQLSTRQLQSLELLNLPALELEERLSQELAANPVLELAEPLPEHEPETPSDTPPEKDDEAAIDARTVESSDEWADELPVPGDTVPGGVPDEVREYLMNSPAAPPSLQEQLQDELNVAVASPAVLRAAEQVIDSLDDAGYFRSTAADVAMTADVELAEAERALKLIQSFDPAGVGARDVGECLRLQLERRGKLDPVMEKILGEHLDDVARNRLPQLARELGITLDDLNLRLAMLRSETTPHPCSTLVPPGNDFVQPEAAIVRGEDGKFEAVPLRGSMPRVYLSERYLRMLDDASLPPDAANYIREKVRQARELMRALELRGSTIMRITDLLTGTQSEFFENGVEFLKPLTMKQVGEKLELHETTISRAVANKFVKTPRGVLPYKYFFTSGFTGENGETVSNRAVMEKIRELIGNEDPTRPLSDDQLAGMLKAGGLAVARRTVAKYRESLNIPSSNLRRIHR